MSIQYIHKYKYAYTRICVCITFYLLIYVCLSVYPCNIFVSMSVWAYLSINKQSTLRMYVHIQIQYIQIYIFNFTNIPLFLSIYLSILCTSLSATCLDIFIPSTRHDLYQPRSIKRGQHRQNQPSLRPHPSLPAALCIPFPPLSGHTHTANFLQTIYIDAPLLPLSSFKIVCKTICLIRVLLS